MIIRMISQLHTNVYMHAFTISSPKYGITEIWHHRKMASPKNGITEKWHHPINR